MNTWIGFDLDHTLAHYEKGQFPEIGEPIPEMIELVKDYLINGFEVRIVTARVHDVAALLGQLAFMGVETPEHYKKIVEIDIDQRRRINEWCKKHIGKELPLTNAKDQDMELLYDDRARQVIANKGIVVEEPED